MKTHLPSLLRRLLRSSGDAIAIFDRDGSLVESNELHAEMYRSADLSTHQNGAGVDLLELRKSDGTLLPPHEWPVAKVLTGESESGNAI